MVCDCVEAAETLPHLRWRQVSDSAGRLALMLKELTSVKDKAVIVAFTNLLVFSAADSLPIPKFQPNRVYSVTDLRSVTIA